MRFDDYAQGVACVRALSQSGLNPANCRLLDPLELDMPDLGLITLRGQRVTPVTTQLVECLREVARGT